MRHLAGGDDLFHLARVRKLDAFGDLSLRSVDEFRDGGLHPGYAFPLWHAFLALVARLAGVDPSRVVLHEASVLVPAAFLVAWESGKAVFRSAWGALAVLAAQVGIFALAAGSGGAYRSLALPPTASRQLLVPAVIALFFGYLHRRSWAGLATVAVAAGALALVHATYALFLLLPLAGYVVARLLLARTDIVEGPSGLAAIVIPAVAVALWLRPIAKETASVSPSAAEVQRALRHYQGQLDVFSDGRYRLAPEVLGRSGAIAVAALFAVPLAVLAAKRRWAALVLGGFLAVLVLMLVPTLFTRFADVVSISQARRAAGFVPFAFAVAGGAAVLARLLSIGALPVGLAAGIAFQLAYPGDFGYSLVHGGPAVATWVALGGGGGCAGRRGRPAAPPGRARPDRADRRRDRPPGRAPGRGARIRALGQAARARRGADAGTGTRAAGGRAEGGRRVLRRRDELPDRCAGARLRRDRPARPRRRHEGEPPVARRDDARMFFRTGDLAIPRRYGATWLVIDRNRSRLRLDLPIGLRGRAVRPLPSAPVKVLLVSLYFPPAGGGGVQRTLKTAAHLPALGIETHVLAPDDPKWVHRDDELAPPTQAWVHRARYVGPRGRRPADELHGTAGLTRVGVQARLLGRRLLVPDENVPWNVTAIPAAIRIARQEGIDVVLTTSPPGSIHFVGAAVKRATGARWVADLRDPLVGHQHRRTERRLVRLKEQGQHGVAALVARYADAIVTAAEAISEETRALGASRAGRDDRERLRLRRLRRAGASPVDPLPDHARGQLLRPARPATVPDARSPSRGSTSSRGSPATSGRPTASGPATSGSATGWS